VRCEVGGKGKGRDERPVFVFVGVTGQSHHPKLNFYAIHKVTNTKSHPNFYFYLNKKSQKLFFKQKNFSF
jgi:hypothetical protein